MSSGGRANLLVQVHCLSLKSPLLPSPLLSIRQCIRLDHAAISCYFTTKISYNYLAGCRVQGKGERGGGKERGRERENTYFYFDHSS